MAVSAATVIRLRSRLDSPGRSQTSPNRTFSLRSMSFGATGRTTSRAVVGAGCVLTVGSFLMALLARVDELRLYRPHHFTGGSGGWLRAHGGLLSLLSAIEMNLAGTLRASGV